MTEWYVEFKIKGTHYPANKDMLGDLKNRGE